MGTEADGGSRIRDVGLRALLGRHPDALVLAIGNDSLSVPVPSSVPVDRHRVPEVRSGLDLVRAGDRLATIAAWERAIAEGVSTVEVELAGSPGERAVAHFFDVTAQHGAVVVVVVPAHEGTIAFEEIVERPPSTPRVVRARKNELALFLEVGDEISAVLGWTPEEMIGRRTLEFVHPDDHALASDAWLEARHHPGATARARVRHRHRDGHWVWLELANRNLFDDPDHACMECVLLDVSEEMAAIEAVRASEQLLRRLAEALPVGVVQFGLDRHIVFANEALYRIVGVEPGAPEHLLAGFVHDLDCLRKALADALEGADVDLELGLDRGDGLGVRRCTLALRTLTTTEGEVSGAVGCLTDITESSRLRSELERRATIDPLTDCVNRSAALATLADALLDRRQGTAVMFVDLDNFKAVNDECGHAVGDRVLVAVAARLHDAVRAGDVVGRIGGDEFLVICPDVASGAAALALAERVASLVTGPIDVGTGTTAIRPSIGVAWVSGGDLVDAEALIASADEAMYRSKRAGAGKPVLADPRDARSSRRPQSGVGPSISEAGDPPNVRCHLPESGI